MIRQYDSYDLTRRNTFRMRVSCRLFVECTALSDLSSLDFSALPQPVLTMGGGSNLLFTKDFQGTVLHLAFKGRTVRNVPDGTVTVRLGAGVVFDGFCAWAAAEGLWGPENLSLIPGEAGASAVQNIGAYGVEVKDLIETVHVFDPAERRFKDIPCADCGYGYRTSRFKTEWKGRYLVTAVTFRLSRTPQPRLDYGGVRQALGEDLAGLTPQRVRDAVIAIRRRKLPDPEETGSAGSFFCNPLVDRAVFRRIEEIARAEGGEDAAVPHYDAGGLVKVPAAWLIDQCGLKGASEGGAQVYPNQPLVIVNAGGNASPADVLALERRVVEAVRARFGVELRPEVEHI